MNKTQATAMTAMSQPAIPASLITSSSVAFDGGGTTIAVATYTISKVLPREFLY